MDITDEYFQERKEKAKNIYTAQGKIYCPYFKHEVVLNSDGFHHLQFSGRKERTRKAQLFKFSFLCLGLEIIRKSGTIQEYRATLQAIGKKAYRTGAVGMKSVEFWGLVAIVGGKGVKVRVVLRRVGDGNITFWSVMPYSKIKDGRQKIYDEGIEEE